MTEVQFPLNAENVAQVVAERDAEIERLRVNLACAERVLSRFLAHQLSHQESYYALRAARDNARAALGSTYTSPIVREAGRD